MGILQSTKSINSSTGLLNQTDEQTDRVIRIKKGCGAQAYQKALGYCLLNIAMANLLRGSNLR